MCFFTVHNEKISLDSIYKYTAFLLDICEYHNHTPVLINLQPLFKNIFMIYFIFFTEANVELAKPDGAVDVSVAVSGDGNRKKAAKKSVTTATG